MSLALRHRPEVIGIQLDDAGWVSVDDLLAGINRQGIAIDRALLQEIVDNNDKKRFAFSEDGLRIRASQGHSVEVDLQLQPVLPPDILYHGTAEKNLESILAEGIKKVSRQYVHLSATTETALQVGSRHGKPVLLTIHAQRMTAAGFLFYLSANGVWLTEEVPAEFVELTDKS